MPNIPSTDPQEELLIEVNSNNEVVGPISRKVAHQSPDKIYRTIFVIVKNQHNQILIQKRSSTKDLYPNCWDLSVGGHVNFGTEYGDTAVRELHEELGIFCANQDLKYLGNVLVTLPSSKEFFAVYEYILKPSDKIVGNTDEVSKIKWMLIDEIKTSMANQSLDWYPRPIQIIQALY